MDTVHGSGLASTSSPLTLDQPLKSVGDAMLIAIPRGMSCDRFDCINGVTHGDGAAGTLHHRQVVDLIADHRNL